MCRNHLTLRAVLPQHELSVWADTMPLSGLPCTAPAPGPGHPRSPLWTLETTMPHGLRDHTFPSHPGSAQLLQRAEARVWGPAEEPQSNCYCPPEEDEEDAEHHGLHEEANWAHLWESGGDGWPTWGRRGGPRREQWQLCWDPTKHQQLLTN